MGEPSFYRLRAAEELICCSSTRLSTSVGYLHCVQRGGLGQAAGSKMLILFQTRFTIYLKQVALRACPISLLGSAGGEETWQIGLSGFNSRIHLRICPQFPDHPRNEEFKSLQGCGCVLGDVLEGWGALERRGNESTWGKIAVS